MHGLLVALLLLGASTAKKPSRDPRAAGLGRSCQKNADCKHGAQRCVNQSDANGKPLQKAFCVLPCASFEEGTQKAKPGAPVDVNKKPKAPPARCPSTYQCRSAGAGVPIDICVKQ